MITRFSTALEPDLLAAFDQFISRHGYQNRSEAVRGPDPVKNLVDEQWRSGARYSGGCHISGL